MQKQILCRAGWMLAGVALAGSVAGAFAQTTVHVYRFELSLRSGDAEYRGNIPTGVPVTGPSHEVERNQIGRILRETDFENGKAVTSWKYHYAGLQRFYDGRETWIDGSTGS